MNAISAMNPRDQLLGSHASTNRAGVALVEAESSLAGAHKLLAAAEADLDPFADLDAAITEHRAAAVRGSVAEGGALPSMVLPPELAARRAAKLEAVAHRDSLVDVVAVLTTERNAAKQAVTLEHAGVREAAVNVMAADALAMAERLTSLQVEMAAVQRQLIGAVAQLHGSKALPAVNAALDASGMQFWHCLAPPTQAKLMDLWTAYRKALESDPEARLASS